MSTQILQKKKTCLQNNNCIKNVKFDTKFTPATINYQKLNDNSSLKTIINNVRMQKIKA